MRKTQLKLILFTVECALASKCIQIGSKQFEDENHQNIVYNLSTVPLGVYSIYCIYTVIKALREVIK